MKLILVSIVLLLCLAMAALYLGQRALIFPAPEAKLPTSLPASVEVIETRIGYALLLHPDRTNLPAPLLVYAHGNAEVAHWSLDEFSYFRDRGFAVLLLEYPGYAGAPGKVSARSTVEAGLLAINKVLARASIDENKLILHGRSIGSGVAAQLARKLYCVALILESPFTSMKNLVSELGYPAFLLTERFDNASAVAALNIPVFLYHGTEDELIPFHHSEELARLGRRSTLLTAPCGHNDCPRPWNEIMAFLVANGIIRH